MYCRQMKIIPVHSPPGPRPGRGSDRSASQPRRHFQMAQTPILLLPSLPYSYYLTIPARIGALKKFRTTRITMLWSHAHACDYLPLATTNTYYDVGKAEAEITMSKSLNSIAISTISGDQTTVSAPAAGWIAGVLREVQMPLSVPLLQAIEESSQLRLSTLTGEMNLLLQRVILCGESLFSIRSQLLFLLIYCSMRVRMSPATTPSETIEEDIPGNEHTDNTISQQQFIWIGEPGLLCA